jgi:glycine cleavage system H protein
MPEVPPDMHYTDEHEWIAKTKGGNFRLGITDHAQEELGDIVFIGELPEVGDRFDQGDVVGVVESTKATSDIYAPLSGKVVAVNEDLIEEPEHVNKSPYGAGWLIEFKIGTKADLDELLTADQYTQLLSHN